MLKLLLVALAAQASVDPVCENRFVSLLQPRPVQQWAFPARIAVPLTSPEVTRSFDLALQAWNNRVDLQRLSRQLSRIESDPLSGEDFLKSLKEARKYASVLKSHYQLLSAGHKAPQKFDEFQKMLGDLNDAITNRGGKKEIRELAHTVRKLAEKVPGAIEEAGFRAASISSLRSRLDGIRDSISEITGDALPTPKTFHEARKSAKELLAYHMSQEALEPGSGGQPAYDFLYRLNEEMGALHDDFITQARNGELDYERQKFFLNPNLKSKLQQLESALAAD